MPITLIAPTPGKTPYYAARGKHYGVRVNNSTKARTEKDAKRVVKKWEREIERGHFAEPNAPTFASAAADYMTAGGDARFLLPLINHFLELPLKAIDQAAIDQAAIALYPGATPATRNRQVYTPVSAIQKYAGVELKLRRPKGSRGRQVTAWLQQAEHAFMIIDQAEKDDLEFGLFLTFLLYSGERLTSALSLTCDNLSLEDQTAYFGKTKNGDPRTVYLTPHMIAELANHPRGLERGREKVFRFHKSSALYFRLESACMQASGLPKPRRDLMKKRIPKKDRPPYRFDFVGFHTFCHTWASWMRRYGGLDALGLIETGRWRSRQSVDVYTHSIVGEAARKADLLPTPSGKGDRGRQPLARTAAGERNALSLGPTCPEIV